MGRRNGSSRFIETHSRIAPGTGAKTTTYEVHVPSTLSRAKVPLSAKQVAQSERYGRDFIRVTPHGSYPEPHIPSGGAGLSQDSLPPSNAAEGSQDPQSSSKGPPEACGHVSPNAQWVCCLRPGHRGRHFNGITGWPREQAAPLTAADAAVVTDAILAIPVAKESEVPPRPKGKSMALSVGNGRPFEPGNQAARGKKPKLAMLGLPLSKIEVSDPLLASYMRKAEYYLKRRSRELAAMFGYTSAAVNGILSSAALQLAHSKYLTLKAIEVGIPTGNEAGDVSSALQGGYLKYMTLAQQLQNAARSNELAAYELCAKEAGVAKTNPGAQAAWIRSGDSE